MLRWAASAAGLWGCGAEHGLRATCDEVVVNEVLASSDNVTLDGRVLDWVELYNPGDEALDLTGFRITTNSELRTLELRPEDRLLPSRGFLVWVASQDVVPGRSVIGIDFNRDGNTLLLQGPGGSSCQEIRYPDQHSDYSWSRLEDGGDRCARTRPTPEASNEDAWRLSGGDFPCAPDDLADFGPRDHSAPVLVDATATCDEVTQKIRIAARSDPGWLQNPGLAHVASAAGEQELVWLQTENAADDGGCDVTAGLTRTLGCADLKGIAVLVRAPWENGCAGCAVTRGEGDAAFFDGVLAESGVLNEDWSCPAADDDGVYRTTSCEVEVRVDADDVGSCVEAR